MKTIHIFLLVLILSLCVKAQQSNSSDATGTAKPTPGGSSTGTESPNGGKVPVPPEKSRPINIPKTATAPVIDGHVDEEVWKQAAVFKDFYQTGPGYNTPPSRPTEAYVMYDEHNLYIAFKCWDEKDKIRATVAKRDNVFGEDNVRV